ncbi:MAG: MoaD/ThiS family protein [Thermoplasmata archaeon]|nr:MAG: MoaD/ThiS family protein [Thermoplasmata archaeon]
MKIDVNLTKALADIAGSKEFELEFPNKSSMKLSEFFSELVKKHPRMQDLLFESDGSINYHILIFVNDKPIQNKDEKTTKLTNGDIVSFFPIIGGG